MSTSLYQYMDIKKIIIIAIFALNIISIHAENDRMKLLMNSDLSLNQASGTYYWAEEISSGSYYKHVGTVSNFGSICGLTQDSEFEVELIVAGTAGANTGVVLIPYDKNGIKLTIINGFLWNKQLSADYTTINAKFSIPLQTNYTIKDIDSIKAYVYNIDYLSGEEVWVKNFKLYVDKSTLLKNLYFEEYESTDSGVITKDNEWCKQFDSGYYTFVKQVNIDEACNLGADTVFEFQIKACGTSNTLLGAYACVYDDTDTKIGAINLMWNKTLDENTLKYYNAQFTFENFNVENIAYVKLYVYRCNQLGTIWFNAPALYTDLNQEIFNKEYIDGDLDVELHNSEWALKIDSSYYYLCQEIDFPDKHDVFESSSYEINILAAGDSLLGARLQLLDDSDNLLESISTNLWNSDLTTDYQWHSATFKLPENESYDLDDIKKVKIYLYRCNQQDTVWINSVVLKCLNYEINYKEIENNLVRDGFSLSEDNNTLIAHKTDQRDYYQILSNANDLKKYKYLGTTYVKPSAVANYFPTGVYIYKTEAEVLQLATDWGISTAQVFQTIAQDLASHNCNTVYFSCLSPYPTTFNLAVQKFQESGISVFGQFNGSCYLITKNGRSYYESVTAPAAELLLPNYHNTSGIVGWMGGEEAEPEKIPLVQDYRALCKQADPYHGTYTLHNNLTSQKLDSMNLPDWFGFDRYEFRELINSSYGMKIGTPLFGINVVNKDVSNNYWATAKIGRPLIFVGQGYGVQYELNASLLQSEHGVNISQMTAKSGFIETSPGIWKGWLKYLPPANCMHLQTWTAIAAGAKGILLFHYFDRNIDLSTGLVQNKALVDNNLTETAQWLEFKNSISSIEPLTPLFSQWHKEWEAKATADANNKKWIIVSSFIKEFDAERYLTIVNKRIGEWDTDSPEITDDNTQLYYDDNGLDGITTVGALSFELDIEGNEDVWDILTGNQLSKNANDKYDLTLDPGRGVVLMQGTQAQLTAIRTELGL